MLKRKKMIFSILILFVFLCLILIIWYSNKPQKHRLQWWLSDISWEANRNNLSGENVKIALIDTGVDFGHSDLKKCSFVEKTVIGSEKGDTNHGTAIAGIICGMPSNDKGILGIAPNAKLISIDVTNEETVKTESLIKGIKEAIKAKVDIINISIGVKEDKTELHECIREAYDDDIVIVASAGNYMDSEILYPAAYDETIAIGAYDKKKKIISPKGNVKNVIYLPGKNIATCISGNKYAGVQGTSFSTAIMTGIIAVAKEKYPELSNDFIYKKIYEVEKTNNKDIKVTSLLDEFKE